MRSSPPSNGSTASPGPAPGTESPQSPIPSLASDPTSVGVALPLVQPYHWHGQAQKLPPPALADVALIAQTAGRFTPYTAITQERQSVMVPTVSVAQSPQRMADPRSSSGSFSGHGSHISAVTASHQRAAQPAWQPQPVTAPATPQCSTQASVVPLRHLAPPISPFPHHQYAPTSNVVASGAASSSWSTHCAPNRQTWAREGTALSSRASGASPTHSAHELLMPAHETNGHSSVPPLGSFTAAGCGHAKSGEASRDENSNRDTAPCRGDFVAPLAASQKAIAPAPVAPPSEERHQQLSQARPPHPRRRKVVVPSRLAPNVSTAVPPPGNGIGVECTIRSGSAGSLPDDAPSKGSTDTFAHDGDRSKRLLAEEPDRRFEESPLPSTMLTTGGVVSSKELDGDLRQAGGSSSHDTRESSHSPETSRRCSRQETMIAFFRTARQQHSLGGNREDDSIYGRSLGTQESNSGGSAAGSGMRGSVSSVGKSDNARRSPVTGNSDSQDVREAPCTSTQHGSGPIDDGPYSDAYNRERQVDSRASRKAPWPAKKEAKADCHVRTSSGHGNGGAGEKLMGDAHSTGVPNRSGLSNSGPLQRMGVARARHVSPDREGLLAATSDRGSRPNLQQIHQGMQQLLLPRQLVPHTKLAAAMETENDLRSMKSNEVDTEEDDRRLQVSNFDGNRVTSVQEGAPVVRVQGDLPESLSQQQTLQRPCIGRLSVLTRSAADSKQLEKIPSNINRVQFDSDTECRGTQNPARRRLPHNEQIEEDNDNTNNTQEQSRQSLVNCCEAEGLLNPISSPSSGTSSEIIGDHKLSSGDGNPHDNASASPVKVGVPRQAGSEAGTGSPAGVMQVSGPRTILSNQSGYAITNTPAEERQLAPPQGLPHRIPSEAEATFNASRESTGESTGSEKSTTLKRLFLASSAMAAKAQTLLTTPSAVVSNTSSFSGVAGAAVTSQAPSSRLSHTDSTLKAVATSDGTASTNAASGHQLSFLAHWTRGSQSPRFAVPFYSPRFDVATFKSCRLWIDETCRTIRDRERAASNGDGAPGAGASANAMVKNGKRQRYFLIPQRFVDAMTEGSAAWPQMNRGRRSSQSKDSSSMASPVASGKVEPPLQTLVVPPQGFCCDKHYYEYCYYRASLAKQQPGGVGTPNFPVVLTASTPSVGTMSAVSTPSSGVTTSNATTPNRQANAITVSRAQFLADMQVLSFSPKCASEWGGEVMEVNTHLVDHEAAGNGSSPPVEPKNYVQRRFAEMRGRPTLALDLDETLVHTSDNMPRYWDPLANADHLELYWDNAVGRYRNRYPNTSWAYERQRAHGKNGGGDATLSGTAANSSKAMSAAHAAPESFIHCSALDLFFAKNSFDFPPCYCPSCSPTSSRYDAALATFIEMKKREQASKEALKKVLALATINVMDQRDVEAARAHAETFSKVVFPDPSNTMFVELRPYVRQFLNSVAQVYEVMFFTASSREYADAVFDYLDPEHQVLARLFNEHCSEVCVWTAPAPAPRVSAPRGQLPIPQGQYPALSPGPEAHIDSPHGGGYRPMEIKFAALAGCDWAAAAQQHQLSEPTVYIVKMLHRLGRPLDRVIIMDNSSVAYCMSRGNALPVVDFLGQEEELSMGSQKPTASSANSLGDLQASHFAALIQQPAIPASMAVPGPHVQRRASHASDGTASHTPATTAPPNSSNSTAAPALSLQSSASHPSFGGSHSPFPGPVANSTSTPLGTGSSGSSGSASITGPQGTIPSHQAVAGQTLPTYAVRPHGESAALPSNQLQPMPQNQPHYVRRKSIHSEQREAYLRDLRMREAARERPGYVYGVDDEELLDKMSFLARAAATKDVVTPLAKYHMELLKANRLF